MVCFALPKPVGATIVTPAFPPMGLSSSFARGLPVDEALLVQQQLRLVVSDNGYIDDFLYWWASSPIYSSPPSSAVDETINATTSGDLHP